MPSGWLPIGLSPENRGLTGHVFVVSSPLRAGQALPLRLFLPVRRGVGTDDPSLGAHHVRPERWHWHTVRPAIGTQHR
jgi:hypothetical protein